MSKMPRILTKDGRILGYSGDFQGEFSGLLNHCFCFSLNVLKGIFWFCFCYFFSSFLPDTQRTLQNLILQDALLPGHSLTVATKNRALDIRQKWNFLPINSWGYRVDYEQEQVTEGRGRDTTTPHPPIQEEPITKR